ncbi:MAG: lysozyme family protein [Frisingicoccus sp.]|nr:lysozyme family protein [Frisingicoccus sp.]
MTKDTPDNSKERRISEYRKKERMKEKRMRRINLRLALALIILLLIVFARLIFDAAFSDSKKTNDLVTEEVTAYTSTIKKYARKYNISSYVPVIKAIMMQESGGRGTDPMQCSECPFNTDYPNTPNAIQDPEYSVEVGIKYFAHCLEEAECTGPKDMERLKLSLQGYNYGNGYITWAVENYGGYSEANALIFSQEQAAYFGWNSYGDPEYVAHVLRYY